MNESFNDYNDGGSNFADSSRWVEILTAIWLCFILIFGTFLNGTTLVIFISSRVLSASNNILIATLLVNNIGMAVFGIPLAIVAEISKGWLVHLNMKACIYNAFTVYLFAESSMFLLTLISLTRFFVITRPSTIGKKITVKVTICTICLCYVLAVIVAVMPLIGLGSYGLEEHETSCGMDWQDRSVENKAYLMTILCVSFGIPVVIMIFCYGSIYLKVRKAAVATDTQTSRRYVAQRKRESHLLKTCVIIVVAFVLSWTPYTVVSFYQSFGPPGTRLSPILTRIPAVIAKTSVLWDPIIYALNTSSFRRQARGLFGIGRSESSEQEESAIEGGVVNVSALSRNNFTTSVSPVVKDSVDC